MDNFRKWEEEQIVRVLYSIEFDVPKRPIRLSEQYREATDAWNPNTEKIPRRTELEKERGRVAERISPRWFYNHKENCFIDTLDRIILVTDEDLGLFGAEIAGFRVSEQTDDGLVQLMDIGDTVYQMITSFPPDHLTLDGKRARGNSLRHPAFGEAYADRFPTTKYIVALSKVESCQTSAQQSDPSEKTTMDLVTQ